MLNLLEGTANDLLFAQSVLEAVYPHHAGARAYHAPRAPQENPFQRLWLAQLERQTVGFAQIRTSSLHPQADYPSVAVLPAFQARGVGSTLMEALETTFKGRERLQQTALFESQTVARASLQKRGFREKMRTYTVKLQSAQVALEPFKAAYARALGMGLTFTSLLEFPHHADEVARLHHRVYQAHHTFNPVPDFSLERMRELWLGDEMNPATLFLALEDRKPVGFAALYGEGQALELAYFGTSPEHPALEPWLSPAIVGQALEFAAARRAVLEAEFDSLNPAAMAVLEALGVDGGEAWVTYQRAPRATRPVS